MNMNTYSKILALSICLQLTVGSPILGGNISIANEGGTDRSPSSEKSNMSADEVIKESKNYIKTFQETCTDANGNINGNKAWVLESDIGESEPNINNCSKAAEFIRDSIIPGMNDISRQAKANADEAGCTDCAVKNPVNLLEADDQVKSCSAETELKLKKSQKCSFACDMTSAMGLSKAGCHKSSGITTGCFTNLAAGVLKAITEIFTWPIDLAKSGYDYLFGKGETKVSNKAKVVMNLSDDQIKKIKKMPKKEQEKTFAENAYEVMASVLGALSGTDEYERRSKCANCKEKADLMCQVIGTSSGTLISFFASGVVIGAAKGSATTIAGRILAKSPTLAKWARATAKVGSKMATSAGNGLIKFGGFVVSGAAKVASPAVKWWDKFKATSVFTKIKTFTNRVSTSAANRRNAFKETIPGKVTYKIASIPGKVFKGAGNLYERNMALGEKIANKALGGASKTSKGVAVVGKVGDKTKDALNGVDELQVIKPVQEARSTEQWSKLKNEAADDLNVSAKKLDDIENAEKASFETIKGKKEGLTVDTPAGEKEIKIARPSEVQEVHTYQNGKYAVVKNKQGYSIHDLDADKVVVSAASNKDESIKALIGKKTKKFDDLEDVAHNQVKTNLELNGTKHKEKIDPVTGQKSLEIETPKGCQPGSINFGVKGA